MDWANKAEVRAVAHRKMLEAVLANPDNEPERALQKKLKVSGRGGASEQRESPAATRLCDVGLLAQISYQRGT